MLATAVFTACGPLSGWYERNLDRFDEWRTLVGFRNWLNGAIADGSDASANFSTLNITVDNAVHLDTVRTAGTLLFGDTTPSNNWTLDNNGIATNILTLATSSNSPTITVNNQSATIGTVLAGNQGFNKSGSGTLILDAANTYSGTTTLTTGTIQLAGAGHRRHAQNLAINGGTLDLHGNSQSVASLSGAQGTSGAIVNNASGTNATLTIGNGNNGGDYYAKIADNTSGTGTIGLVKVGNGFVTLYGVSTYSGGTTIDGGGLQFEPTNITSLDNKGTVTLNSSGTFGFVNPPVKAVQAIGALTFASGDGAIADYASSTQTAGLNFASVTLARWARRAIFPPRMQPTALRSQSRSAASHLIRSSIRACSSRAISPGTTPRVLCERSTSAAIREPRSAREGPAFLERSCRRPLRSLPSQPRH